MTEDESIERLNAADPEDRLFTDYVRQYNPEDTKVRLKIIHTWKVVQAADAIAAALELDVRQRQLAHLAALFHDIGRFEQVRRYGTFFDAKSVDHADLGSRILQEEPFLNRLTDQEKELVIEAVRVHNKYAIPDDHTGFQRTLDGIVRDADKIDIFRVACQEDPLDTSGFPLDAVNGTPVSEEVYQAILHHRSVDRTTRRSPLDFWVSFLGFLFDLNFQPSFCLVIRQSFWNQPLKTMLEDNRISDPNTRERITCLLRTARSALLIGAVRDSRRKPESESA